MESGRQPPDFSFKLRLNTGTANAGTVNAGAETIDMTPEGEMLPPPRAGLSWPMRIGVGALIVAVLCGLAASAAILLWLASVLSPIAVVAALIGYAALRFQLWRMRGRDVVRRSTR
jgi:hypothetical protein